MNSLFRSFARIASSKSVGKCSQPPILLLRSFNSKASALKSPSLPSPTDWPRPAEIPFQSKVANLVHLTGSVDEPVLSEHSNDGKFWAATVIAQHFNSDFPTFRIPIVFEGDLAHVAVSHLKERSCIYIAGRLSIDSPPVKRIQGQAQLQVMVHNINFVHGSSQVKESRVPQEQEGYSKDSDPWRDVIGNPKQWWDYRGNKLSGSINRKHPDFKRKDGGLSLWLNRAPRWVFSELEGVEFDVQIPKVKQVKQNEENDSWKDLVENPGKWWDNRMDKKNVKAPDFRHKEHGKALWLSDSPAWVRPKLPPLKAKEKQDPISGRDTLLS